MAELGSPTGEYGPFHVSEDLVRAWADLSGDHNPLHVDAEFAAATSFGQQIAHGHLIAAVMCEAAAHAGGDSWRQAGGIEFKFVAPLYVPSTVTVGYHTTQAEGTATAQLECRDDQGRCCVTAVAHWVIGA